MSEATLIVAARDMSRGAVRVSGDDYRHLFRARRLAVGDRLRVVDGVGSAAWARIERVSGAEAELAIEGPAPTNEASECLEVWAGMPRPQRASWLVEKVTELGATAIRWLEVERGARRPRPPSLERLRRVARSAVEQCGRSVVPEVTGPHPFAEALEAARAADRSWLLTPGAGGAGGIVAVERSVVVVGPEGGFTATEVEELESCGAHTLGLGPQTLRVETAAVAAVALLLGLASGRAEGGP